MTPDVTAPRLSDFFLRLSDDPTLLAAYQWDPEGAMAAAGLSREQVSTVLEGGTGSVRTAVEAEVVADPARRKLIVTPRMVIMTTPEPEPEPEPPKPNPKPKRSLVA